MRPDIYLKKIRLLKDLPPVAKAGDVGTVVEVYVCIEFVLPDGTTKGLVMAHQDSFELFEPDLPEGDYIDYRPGSEAGPYWLHIPRLKKLLGEAGFELRRKP